tara:strand:- start:6485 stop:7225 length:741 start_codon:yes stop_codon:yes gene_type:complete
MSHVSAGKYPVTDLAALLQAVKGMPEYGIDGCPELELVKQNTYKWFGSIVGDSAPTPVYQLQAMIYMVKDLGLSWEEVRELAKGAGVELPESPLQIEENPLDLNETRKLLQIAQFKEAFDKQNEKIGKDAEYVIRYKKEHSRSSESYEIGVIEHPVRKGEYWLSADYWQNGQGLMRAKGLGGVVHERKMEVGPDGKETEVVTTEWGQELKQRYTAAATANIAKQAGRKVKSVEKLPDGKICVETEE